VDDQTIYCSIALRRNNEEETMDKDLQDTWNYMMERYEHVIGLLNHFENREGSAEEQHR